VIEIDAISGRQRNSPPVSTSDDQLDVRVKHDLTPIREFNSLDLGIQIQDPLKIFFGEVPPTHNGFPISPISGWAKGAMKLTSRVSFKSDCSHYLTSVSISLAGMSIVV
jgi:hypothetical protein